MLLLVRSEQIVPSFKVVEVDKSSMWFRAEVVDVEKED